MTAEPGAGFRIVDRRATADDTPAVPEFPAGYRAHSALLGHCSEQQVRELLRDAGAHVDAVERLIVDGQQARWRIARLPPPAAGAAALRLQDAEATAEIARVMSLPQCKSAFPEGSWSAGLVQIATLIPLRTSLDIHYAESLGGTGLDPARLISAARLCFAENHVAPFHVSVDQAQKSVSISGIHAAYEVVGLRCGQQPGDGPLIVSFMVSAPPPIVVVLRHAGRHFLFDGFHRVYRLMQAGFSHVPCIVRDVPGLAEMAALGPRFFQEPALMAPRPPLFPDFADPVLGIVAPLRAMRRVIRIRPDEYFVAS